MAGLSQLRAWKDPMNLVLRLLSKVLIHRNCARSLGCLPSVTTALWWQLAVAKARKQARPSERKWLPGARCRLAQSESTSELKPPTGVILA